MSLESDNYKIIEKQEQVLRFDHFDNEDAWELGSIIVEEAKEKVLDSGRNLD